MKQPFVKINHNGDKITINVLDAKTEKNVFLIEIKKQVYNQYNNQLSDPSVTKLYLSKKDISELAYYLLLQTD